MAQSQEQHTLRGNKFATREAQVARGTRVSEKQWQEGQREATTVTSLFKCFVEGHIIKGDERSGDLRKAFDGSRKTALQT